MVTDSNVLSGARIKIKGIVQGVGFRPFVFSLASRLGVKGWVRNTTAGVDIEIDAPPGVLKQFVHLLKIEAPPLAQIDDISVQDISPNGYAAFEIIPSQPIDDAFQPISPDVSICRDCLHELLDPADRRYLYPFINCTNCGPRYTIIQDVPYDRPNTTMAQFPMCAECRSEYENPLDRRFHAQPIACPTCGPKIWLERSPHSTALVFSLANPHNKNLSASSNAEIIAEVQSLLRQGFILAIKGLGGFHLACDAENPVAVSRLRQRKLRVDKPFALMMPDIETIQRYCVVNRNEVALLSSRERPIVLLEKRPGTTITPEAAPHQAYWGVMLPYSPLHYLLFSTLPGQNAPPPSVLVMTSGNISEEPIAIDNDEARRRLSPLADFFLMHNRPIRTRCDDSVYRIFSTSDNEPVHSILPIRRSRGFAPSPLLLPWKGPHVLATGPELKNTVCLTRDNYAFLSHHIGDMENYETLLSFEDSINQFERLFRISPTAIACDMHPDYLSTRYAQERADRESLARLEIQHHHAHIAACMAENGISGAQTVIGVSLDGTGYGDDGAIWGGEFLLADYAGYKRIYHWRYTPLPGGDAAIRKPARIALAYLYDASIEWDERLLPVQAFSPDELAILKNQLMRQINTPRTSSLGRLFDAVAAIAGVRQVVNYEAQAAIEFEMIANSQATVDTYLYNLQGDEIDFRPAIRQIVHEVLEGAPARMISTKFHLTLAECIIRMCLHMREMFQINEVFLSGGVWQNMKLLKLCIEKLRECSFQVYFHHKVPTNDGGISFGQAAILTHQIVAGKISV